MAACSSTDGMPSTVTKFSQPREDQPLRVKLFGLGSAGCNMIEGAKYPTYAFSTSSADLARSKADRKMLVGPERLVGIAETKHSILRHLPSIAGHEFADVFNNTDLALLFCGLGGMTGSMGAKLFSSIARGKDTPGIVLAATPFSAESIRRRELAQKTLEEILATCTLCIEFDNDMLSSLAPNLPISRAFSLMNGIMQRPVIDMCSGMSRQDVHALKEVLDGARYGRFGLGLGRGDDRVARVVEEGLSSPWFDFPIEDSATALAFYSASDPWDKEADDILSRLRERMPSARIAWGSYADAGLKDRIRLSITTCRENAGHKSRV
jgi:cell division GTPase FtsZ